MNSEPPHFLTFGNNGVTFPSLGGRQLAIVPNVFRFHQGTGKPKGIGFLRPSETPNYQKIILATPGTT